jgi:pimeloyl-ACP methyl ester carboxylesterase
MPFAALSDLGIHYELYGDAGEPLVFVHGYTGDTADCGHGASEACPDRRLYSVEHMVNDTVQLVEKVGFERFHLVGHSIGGAVAQEIALRSPERLLSLTLLDTTHWFGDHEEPGGTPPFTTPEEMRIADQRVARMSEDARAGAWRGVVEWPGSTDRVHEIRARTLIIHGDRDASRIVEGSRRLSELIPHADHVVIKGAGHSPQRQRPEEFNSALERFLGGDRDHTAV